MPRFLQIWIPPAQDDLPPSYEQRSIPPGDNEFALLISPDGAAGSVTIHQDARIYSARLSAGKTLSRALEPTRHFWLQVVTGEVEFGQEILKEGDSVAFVDEASLELVGRVEAEVLLFDLA